MLARPVMEKILANMSEIKFLMIRLVHGSMIFFTKLSVYFRYFQIYISGLPKSSGLNDRAIRSLSVEEDDDQEEDSSGKEDGKEQDIVNLKNVKTVKLSKKPGKSDYERRREENIANNKKLMQELGLDKAVSDLKKTKRKSVKNSGHR